jgi:hypothetical protein
MLINKKLINEYIELILSEGIKDDMRKKYPQYEDEIKYFIENEPQGTNSKYLPWQLKILASEQALHPEIADVVKLFDRYKANLKIKDINAYTPDKFTQLRDELFDIEKKRGEKKEKAKEKYQIEGDRDANVIYDDDEYRVYHIENKAASMHYGSGTKWCITMKNKAYFEDYTATNVVFFFIISKLKTIEDPSYKIAIAVPRNVTNNVVNKEQVQYFDALDTKLVQSEAKTKIGPKFDEMLAKALSVAASAPKSLIARIASGEGTPEDCTEYYEYIKRNPETKTALIKYLVKNPNLPLKILYMLASDEDVDVREMVAINTSNVDVLEMLADDESHNVVLSASDNVNFPQKLLAKFATHNNPNVRLTVARNPSTPLNVLEFLANDDNIYVRSYVAANESTPPELLEKLSDDVEDVVFQIYHNPNVTLKILDKLIDRFTDNPLVLRGVLRADNLNQELLDKITKIMIDGKQYSSFILIAKNKNTTSSNLEKLFAQTMPETSRFNARNPEHEVLKHFRIEIWRALATNQNTPQKVLEFLAKTNNASIRNKALNTIKKLNAPKKAPSKRRSQ